MINKIFSDWQIDDAELLKTDTRQTEFEAVAVADAAARASDLLGIEAPNRDGYIIPLFAVDSPTPINQYVLYDPKVGSIGWKDTGLDSSGIERFTSCEQLRTKIIGQHLRHWLPSNQSEIGMNIDTSRLPPEQINPADQLSDTEQQDFFTELKQFVRSEMEAEREANWENYTDLGLNTAIRRNLVSGPFVHIGQIPGQNVGPAYRIQLAQDIPDDEKIDLRGDEGIFEENSCVIDTKTSGEHFPIEAEIRSVDGPNLTVRPNWDAIDEKAAVQRLLSSDEIELWIHELLNPVPFERQLTAINQVAQNTEKAELLTGQREVEFSANKYELPNSDLSLNGYQRLALSWADGAEDIVCIHGPPGTGKTRTLTAYVKHAVSEGHSVLVTAHSNQAVDNLLVGDSTRHSPEEGTLHAMAQNADTDLTIARIGNNTQNAVVEGNYMNRSASSADIVAATTSGASQFDPDSFDVAVVDEATQASRPATTIVLNCARKLVLAGDHKQLSPFSADETMQAENLHISLFEYLLDRYDSRISVLLRKQYRMNEKIAAFPNDAFYDGDLETADQNRTWTVDDLPPITGLDITGDEQQSTHSNSFYNLQEADAAAAQVKLLVRHGLNPEDIGVITAYSGQTGQIKRSIDQRNIENSRRVSVDTVDSFQGGEREAIIVSFVRSNADGRSGFLAFPEEGPRRLNVALTRARKRVVLIGNWETLGMVAPYRSSEESCAQLYADLAKHMRDQDHMISQKG